MTSKPFFPRSFTPHVSTTLTSFHDFDQPLIDEDGFQRVLLKKNLALQHRRPPRHTIQKEAKSFAFQLQRTLQGEQLQITVFHPSLTRSDLIPLPALPWFHRVLLNSIEADYLTVPQWTLHSRPKLKTNLIKNLRGRFRSITEYLPDHRSYSPCITEGHRASGWFLFEADSLASRSTPRSQILFPLHP